MQEECMHMTFLGTGTSHGVPEIGCNCEVCTSSNPKNNRLRPSVLLTDDAGHSLLIDASADFRQQALRVGMRHLTDILLTHAHADHILGLDDTRIFIRNDNTPINLYLDVSCDQRIRQTFAYAYQEGIQVGGGLPKFNNIIIAPGQTFTAGAFTVTALALWHGKLPILGYRIGRFAYLTDCSNIPEESFDDLHDLDVLVLDALRPKPHPTHFSVAEAVYAAQQIGARRTYFTHMTHNVDHDAANAELPAGIEFAYDGLVINL
jgi:phosphoribosyl 1,2-cyclic phosphate phosphodiesterase